jgi:hypothetical protein
MQTEPPNADPPKRKRRWFQFSLRTLLIGVTLLAVPCAYVGLQAKIVRERKAHLQATQATHVGGWNIFVFARGDKTKAPTGIRLWLGDEAHDSVIVDRDASEETKQAVAALFPESDILNWP